MPPRHACLPGRLCEDALLHVAVQASFPLLWGLLRSRVTARLGNDRVQHFKSRLHGPCMVVLEGASARDQRPCG